MLKVEEDPVDCGYNTQRENKMFNNDSEVQIAVLQERFKSHEQIIEKVDFAIQTLSETNQNICKMLAVHDERIDQCNKEDDDISKKVEDIEIKIDNLYKFKWQVGAVIAFVVFVSGIIPKVIPFLTSPQNSGNIERTK